MTYPRPVTGVWLFFAGLCAVLGMVSGFVASRLVEPEYAAQSELFVTVAGAKEFSDLEAGSSYIMRQMPSYAALVNLPEVLDPVVAQLGLPPDGADNLRGVTATVLAETSIIRIKAAATTPDLATRYANATASQMVITVPQLSGKASTGVSVQALVVGAAVPPQAPTKPKIANFVGLGGLAGVGLAGLCWFALPRGSLNSFFRTGGRNRITSQSRSRRNPSGSRTSS